MTWYLRESDLSLSTITSLNHIYSGVICWGFIIKEFLIQPSLIPHSSLLYLPVSACSRSAERARKHHARFTLILRRGGWLSLYFHPSRCYYLTRASECRSRSCDTLFMSRHQTDFPTDGELQAYFHTCRQRSCFLHFTSSPHPAQLTAQWTPRSSRGTSSPPLPALLHTRCGERTWSWLQRPSRRCTACTHDMCVAWFTTSFKTFYWIFFLFLSVSLFWSVYQNSLLQYFSSNASNSLTLSWRATSCSRANKWHISEGQKQKWLDILPGG